MIERALPIEAVDHAASVKGPQGLLSLEACDPAQRCFPAADRLDEASTFRPDHHAGLHLPFPKTYRVHSVSRSRYAANRCSGDVIRQRRETRPLYLDLADALSADSVRPSIGKGAFANRDNSRDTEQLCA